MYRTETKKGASGKFLALLASLTMMLAGLVGVAFASPASAVEVTATYEHTTYQT